MYFKENQFLDEHQALLGAILLDKIPRRIKKWLTYRVVDCKL